MLDLKHATMTTEARAIVTVRGYGFCPDVILDRFRGAQFPVENDVREPDWMKQTLSVRRMKGSMSQQGLSHRSLSKLRVGWRIVLVMISYGEVD